VSRYSLPCPNCDAIIGPTQVPFESSGTPIGFPCPACGARLRVVVLHKGMIWIASIIGSGVIFYLCGRRGWDLIALTLFGSLALFFALVFVMGAFPAAVRLEQMPPEQPVASNRDLSLNLKDKPPR
jgi:hypothetical protein